MIIMNRWVKQFIAAHVVIGNYLSYLRLPPDSLTTFIWLISTFNRTIPSNNTVATPVNVTLHKDLKAKLK
jgi:hypothetical protein